jgi:hypothetical protein
MTDPDRPTPPIEAKRPSPIVADPGLSLREAIGFLIPRRKRRPPRSDAPSDGRG